MDKATLEALDASIKHWEENVAAARPEDASVWADKCALCAMFYGRSNDEPCEGCPVYEVTSMPECAYTPWKYARAMLAKWRMFDNSGTAEQKMLAKQDWVEAATNELNFLKAIRPIGGNMGRSSMFNEKDRAKIALMRQHGLTYREIGERYNCHGETIRYFLKPRYVKVGDRANGTRTYPPHKPT